MQDQQQPDEDLEKQLREIHRAEIITEEMVRSIQRKLDQVRANKDVKTNLRSIQSEVLAIRRAERDRVRKLTELDAKIDEGREQVKRAKQAAVEAATSSSSDVTENADCIVCQQDVKLAPWTTLCPHCKQKFHMSCFNRWISIRPICPHCTQKVMFVNIPDCGIIHIDDFITPL